TWAVRCNEDLPAGTQIVVIDVEGIILVVKAC
ncbi:NfeD family protein, partial [Photobacterium damselae subsp. damselae]|nr:NfeD family protein [Photobacterium damselae subsp. damselae]NVP02926.1 NfeD family protein [Photobacterium damselae subsp. damselae]